MVDYSDIDCIPIQEALFGPSYQDKIDRKTDRIPWRNEKIDEIADEYRIVQQRRNCPDQYIFMYKFGEGKSSFGLAFLEENDVWITSTHKQIREDIDTHEEIHNSVNTLHIVGWKNHIGLGENKEYMPQRVINARKQEPQILDQLQEITEQENGLNTPKEIISKFWDRYGKQDSEIIRQWQWQFDQETWKEKAVFCTPDRLDMIERRAFMQGMDYIMADEGVEKSFPGREWESKSEQISSLNCNYKPETSSLDKSDMDELREIAKKLVDHVRKMVYYRSGYKVHANGQRKEYGLIDPIRQTADPELIQDFKNLWNRLNNYGGANSRTSLEREQLKADSNPYKLKRFNAITEICEKIWNALDTKLYYKKQAGEVAQIEMHKPAMFYLWKFCNKANVENWILDATVSPEYLSHLFRKFRWHIDNPVIDVEHAYLGNGTETEEYEDKSYNSITPEDIGHISYEHYVWDRKVKHHSGKRASVTLSTAKNNDMIGELKRLLLEKARHKEIGLISYKTDIVDEFEDTPIRAVNFEKEEGTNSLKDVDELYILGSPPNHREILKNYIIQYREVPEWTPSDFPETMIETPAEVGGLRGYLDQKPTNPEEEHEDKENIETEPTDTHWKEFFLRNIVHTVFDSCFRLRPDYVNSGRVICIGMNPFSFFNGPHTGASKHIAEDLPDEKIIEEWDRIKEDGVAGVYRHSEVVKKSGGKYSLKEKWKRWKKIKESSLDLFGTEESKLAERLDVSERTISDLKKAVRNM